MSAIWESALSSIESKIKRHNFDMWFKPIQCAAVEGDRILLRAPNRYIKEWFEDNYLETMVAEIRSQTAHEYRVVIEIDEETAPEGAVAAAEAEGTPVAPPAAPAIPAAAEAPAAAHRLLAKYKFDLFVVGPSNQLAHAAARAVAELPAGRYNPLFVYGGVGLGKTHLLQAIGHAIHLSQPSWNICYLNAEAFMNEYVNSLRSNRIDEFRRRYREHCDVLLMDDIQFLAGKDRTQDEFFHTFNSLYESHRQIVVSADKYPHEIPDLEERIKSRFQWGLVADIHPPDLETRIAIIQKKAESDKIDLPHEVAHFLATHIKSNVRELEGLLIRVAAFSHLQNQPITIDFAKETLKNFLSQTAYSLTVEAVQKEVANFFNVKLVDLKSHHRHQAIARPRQIAMYLARKLVKSSYPELGSKFGGKDHTTVLSACRKITDLLTKDPKIRHSVEEIERRLTQ
ncbi:MAG: chromosomal replication initiator protein DnaA [Myxococcales bacterium]|nr:chromosomal replication initiator protein DnaA [Myxococcales bacterium]